MMEIISDLQRVVEWCQFSFGCLFRCSFLRMYALLQSEQENREKIVRRMMKLISGFLLGKEFKQALFGVMSCMFGGWIFFFFLILHLLLDSHVSLPLKLFACGTSWNSRVSCLWWWSRCMLLLEKIFWHYIGDPSAILLPYDWEV